MTDDDSPEVQLERRNAFLIRARDCCYLTFDRMHGEKNHPIINDLNAELKTIEAVLQGIDIFYLYLRLMSQLPTYSFLVQGGDGSRTIAHLVNRTT